MLKKFKGGIHPNGNKSMSSAKAIENCPAPNKIILPISMHIGAPNKIEVEKGQQVKKGQRISSNEAFVSSPIHSPVSGVVTEIGEYNHPMLGKCMSVEIENDFKEEWQEGILVERDYKTLSPEEMLNIVKECGIVGMGGATFPTHVKLLPPKDKKIDIYIVDGAECEPYLTADHRLMVERSEKVIEGMLIVMRILSIPQGFIGIEDNKPDAIAAMEKASAGTNIKVVPLKAVYPQGAEKMLIKVVAGREIPPGGLPSDVGAVVTNVSTCKAISDAVSHGIPLIERIMMVSGGAIKEPKNLFVKFGTPVSHVLDFCGNFKEKPEKVLLGGPMMGFAQYTTDIPITKGTSGVLALTSAETNTGEETNCIRCGRCVEACPLGLNPSMLSILGQKGRYKNAKEEYHLLDCIECGACVYECPAKRNIVQYVKYSKMKNAQDAAAAAKK